MAVAYLTGCVALAGASIAAVFGFAHPVLDLFNHMQPVLFVGSLGLLLATPFFVRVAALRPVVLALMGTALMTSAFTYVPEAIRGLASYSPLPGDDRPIYKLVTFNVFGRNEDTDALIATILDEDADIVALQEYNSHVRRRVHDDLIARYPHYQYCVGGYRAFVGLYSKLPFTPLNEDACSASATSEDRTARIIVRFQPETGAPFSVATTHNDWPAPITRQIEQFQVLREALATVEPPLVLAGDFNSTPWSYALRGFVREAGLVRHTFNLPTFPTLWYYLGDWRPTPAFLPIDHVMTRGDIAIHDLWRGAASGSDHLPVILTFSVGGD